MKKLVIIIVVLIAVGAGVAAYVFLTLPSAPMIPSDHVDRTTCFKCHETGVAGAPQFPSYHLELVDNINECLECHKLEGS